MNEENALFSNWVGSNLSVPSEGYSSSHDMEVALRTIVAQGIYTPPSLWSRFEFEPRKSDSVVTSSQVYTGSLLLQQADDAMIQRTLKGFLTPLEGFIALLALHRTKRYVGSLMTSGHIDIYNIVYVPGKHGSVVTVGLHWSLIFKSWAMLDLNHKNHHHPVCCRIIHPVFE